MCIKATFALNFSVGQNCKDRDTYIAVDLCCVSGAGSTRSITPEGPIQEEPSVGDYFGMNPKLKASGDAFFS